MSGLDGLLPRAAQVGERHAERKRRAIMRQADSLPGVSAHTDGEDVILEGRGLLDRWIREASLRNIGREIL